MNEGYQSHWARSDHQTLRLAGGKPPGRREGDAQAAGIQQDALRKPLRHVGDEPLLPGRAPQAAAQARLFGYIVYFIIYILYNTIYTSAQSHIHQ